MDGKRLEVEVDGNPTPTVQWFKNGQEIEEEFSDGHKHALVATDSTSSYSIVVKSGTTYNVTSGNVMIRSDPVLKNVAVHLNSEVILTVGTTEYNKSDISWSKVSTTPGISDTKTTSYKLEVVQVSELPAAPLAPPPKAPVAKPKIKRSLSNVSALQNQTDTELIVETEMITTNESSSETTRTVKWFIDDIEIVEIDTRYKIVNEESSGTYKLIVKEANEGTAGVYKCKIANEAGYDETSAEFTVSSKPEFMQELEDREALEGETITMDVVIAGNPKPEIQWLRNGVDISNDESILIEKESDTVYILTIEKVTSNSVGTYECVVKNRVGECRSKGLLSLLTAPTFSKDLGELTSARIGDNVALEVVVQGNPRPSVTWYKNGQSITTTVVSENTSNDFRLRFEPVVLEDSAEYYCSAKNKVGVKSSKMIRFTVEPAEAEAPPVEEQKEPEPVPEPEPEPVPEPKVEEPPPKPPVVKPSITNGLSGVNALQGQKDLEFNVQTDPAGADGSPSTVKWYVNDEEISETDPRYQIVKDDLTGAYKLIVKEANDGTAGTYKCQITNEAGCAETSSELSLSSKPEFSLGLEDHEAPEGEPISMDVVISGKPKPEIQWLRNGVEITNDESVAIEKKSDNVYRLTVKKVNSDTAGTYECVIKNSAGETRSKGALTVLKQAVKEEEKVEVKEEPVPPPEEPVAKPKIKRGLSNINADHGQKDIELTVETEAASGTEKSRKVKWFIGDIEITETNKKFKIVNDESSGAHKLIVLEANEETAGLYRCQISNEAGSDETSAALAVSRKPEPKPEPVEEPAAPAPEPLPKFESELTQAEVEVGQSARMEAKVSGDAEIKWYKDDIELKASDRIKTNRTGDGTLRLEIDNVTEQDSGIYKIQASNRTGKKISYAPLRVKKPEYLGIPPKFTKELTRAVVEVGQSTRMEARVKGDPCPDIKWYKDDIALKTSDRIRTNRLEDGTLTLEIDNVTEEDLGLYKILASNSAGDKISIAPLRTPRHEPPIKPEFFVHLLDTDFEEDSTLVLTCKVRGNPEPTVKWLRDGEELILDGDRIKSVMDDDGHITLTIENIEMEEAGKYVCTATNSEGRTRTAAQVNVFKKRPGSARSKTPKEPVPERRSKFQPSDFEIPDRVMPEREPINVSSESHYQNGPDTMLLQHRDPDYPLRVREYLRVGARESPYLANNLRSSYWGDNDIGYGFSPQVAVRERRRFSAIVKEIQTEVTTGEAPSRGRRFFSPHHPELSSDSSYRSSSATRTTGTSGSSFLSSSSTLTNSSNYSQTNYRSTTSSSPFKYSRS